MSWRFSRSPKWVVRHVLVVVLVAVMVWAGFWQLRRLEEKRDFIALVEARQEAAPLDVASVVPAGADVDSDAVDEARYRAVTATGTYLDEETVVVPNRSFNGSPGAWVLTPLLLDDGTAVVVNRGFIGFNREGSIAPPPAPEGEVHVEGLVLRSQHGGQVLPADPEAGGVDEITTADLDRLGDEVEVDLVPAYVQRTASDPDEAAAAQGEAELVPIPVPEPDEGPHLGYAVQWFIFSTIAAGGYLLLLRRVAQDQAREELVASEGGDDLDRELEELLRSES